MVTHEMNVGVIPPIQFFGIAWEEQILVLIHMFGRTPLWSHLVLDFASSFSITNSISLLVISLFKLSFLFVCFSLGCLYVSRKLSISSGLVAKWHLTFASPWTVACQAPLSMGFSRQEYRTGLPFPGDLPNPGIEPRSPALQADSLPLSYEGSPSLLKIIQFMGT